MLQQTVHAHNRGIRGTFEHLYALEQHDLVFLNSVDQPWRTNPLEMLPLTADWDVIGAGRIDNRYGSLRSVIAWGYNRGSEARR